MSTKKKNWFLKRWCSKLLTWLDSLLFGGRATGEFPSAFYPFWWSMIIAFGLGVVAMLWGMFENHATSDRILSIGAYGSLGASIAVAIWYLYSTLRYFPTTGLKIARSTYVVVLGLAGCILGFFAACIFLFVIIGCFVLMILYYAVFGDSKKKSDKIVLEDGTELTEEKGMCGESYYTDSGGQEYERSGDTFTKK